jgi:hypothetical protein
MLSGRFPLKSGINCLNFLTSLSIKVKLRHEAFNSSNKHPENLSCWGFGGVSIELFEQIVNYFGLLIFPKGILARRNLENFDRKIYLNSVQKCPK